MHAMQNLNSQTTSAGSGGVDNRADTKVIGRAIRDADRKMRERLPVLRHQTALGMGFVGLGYTTAAVSALLFINGLIPAWACIVINGVALACSAKSSTISSTPSTSRVDGRCRTSWSSSSGRLSETCRARSTAASSICSTMAVRVTKTTWRSG